MNMGERIKQLRLANGLTQEELGKHIGVQKSAIRKYEKNEVKNMKRSTIETLSKLFKVSPSYLMCMEDTESESKNYSVTIPLLSDFENSFDNSLKKYFLKTITLNEHIPDSSFALQIHDNSMSPLLGIDDIAIVATNFNFESGQTCLILNNDIVMIRKVIKLEDYYELQAMNPYYPVEKTNEVKIYGKIIRAENKSAFK